MTSLFGLDEFLLKIEHYGALADSLLFAVTFYSFELAKIVDVFIQLIQRLFFAWRKSLPLFQGGEPGLLFVTQRELLIQHLFGNLTLRWYQSSFIKDFFEVLRFLRPQIPPLDQARRQTPRGQQPDFAQLDCRTLTCPQNSISS